MSTELGTLDNLHPTSELDTVEVGVGAGQVQLNFEARDRIYKFRLDSDGAETLATLLIQAADMLRCDGEPK